MPRSIGAPIVDRPNITWPNGARVAFHIGLNVEHFEVDEPSTTSIHAGTSHLVPDPLNHGCRDYGARVGFWRMADTLDRPGVRASVLLDSAVGHRYPQIFDAGDNGSGRVKALALHPFGIGQAFRQKYLAKALE